MSVPIECVPNCCDCVTCEIDYFDRPLNGNINNTLTPPPYAGDVNTFTIVARPGDTSDNHACRSNVSNAQVVLDKDIVTDNTRKYTAEFEVLDLATGAEAGIIMSWLDAFHYYLIVIQKVSTGNYRVDIRVKSGTGAAGILRSQTFAFSGTRIWIAGQINIQYETVAAWLFNEVGTTTPALEGTYTDNGGKRVGIGGITLTTPYTFDNFRVCEDHCPPLTCNKYDDNFDRATAPDINDNNSPIIWGYTLTSGRKWQINNNQAWLQSNTNGTLNASAWRANNAPIQGTLLKFSVSASTVGTAISFGFALGGVQVGNFILTFGNQANGTLGTLTYGDGLQTGGGPKPAVLKVPVYAGQTQANITLCIGEHYGRGAMRVTVNTNSVISVLTGGGVGSKPWRYSMQSIAVTGNGSGSGVFINNYSVSDTFDAGFEDSPSCPQCEPEPCTTCTVTNPNTGTANPCGATYAGTWTNGVATNPASAHSISFNKAYVYGYLEMLLAWTAVAGDVITIGIFAGKSIRITAVTPTVGCVEYFDSSVKQSAQCAIGGGLFVLTITEYGIWFGNTPFDPTTTSGVSIHSHQMGNMPTDTLMQASRTVSFGLHSASYLKVDYIKYGRGATGYYPRNTTTIFADEAPYCYSVREDCYTVTDSGFADPSNTYPTATCTSGISGGGEWWICGGDSFNCPDGYPGVYGINTWSANTWFQWQMFPVDYPTPNPGPDDSFFQAGAFMVYTFALLSRYGQSVVGGGGAGLQPEIRVSWNGGAGYLSLKQSKSPSVDSTVYIPEQPPCQSNKGEGYYELVPVGLGLPTTPIKFKMGVTNPADNSQPFALRICVGRGKLVVSVANNCFPYYPLIDSPYSGEVTKWWMGTGQIDQTEWVPGSTESRDWAAMGIYPEYQYNNRPVNAYDTPELGAQDCADCTWPRPTVICPTYQVQITRLKVVVTNTADNTRAWSVPDCSASCSHYNRISILNNQNRNKIWNWANDPHYVLFFAGYHVFGNPYPPVAPNFEACKNQVAFMSAFIQEDDNPLNYIIRISFTGVGQGWGTGGRPYGAFYGIFPKSSFAPCAPFAAKTLLWDTGVMGDLPFPPLTVPTEPGVGTAPAAWGCNMSACTVTVEGLA